MKTDPAQSVTPDSPSTIWPAALLITTLNGGLWFATTFDSTRAGVLLALTVALAGVVGIVVQKARAQSQKRRALWDAYADREMARSAAHPGESSHHRLLAVARALHNRLRNDAQRHEVESAYLCLYYPHSGVAEDRVGPAPHANRQANLLCIELREQPALLQIVAALLPDAREQ